ncbi:nitric oxide dioxygenase [Nitzschia inconspicua]|uniref:Nitric oxide dioxygenase n=1 Tax=Nitzschia inconspicua TaxID=303405 RepID=A0A9K3PX58_9STRA|nr:nitric oxide dioxygenase [Nitzschia inconspicua]
MIFLASRLSLSLCRRAETSAVLEANLRGRNHSPFSKSQQQLRTFAADTVYKFTVTPKHLETVKATLPLVGQAGTDFTKHFYRRMFAANPGLLNVFNQTNQAVGSQPKKLLETVAVAASAAIETGELPGEAIEGICQKHAALHITLEQYAVVGENLLGTIEDLLTTDQAVLEAWGALYQEIATVFVTREKEIADKVASVPGSWSGRRRFKIVDKEKVSSVITRFKFEPLDGKPTPEFEPGTYTTIWVPFPEGEECLHGAYKEQPRHYTLAMPRDGEPKNRYMSISVKKEGLVSSILHDSDIGTEWDLSAPHGCFVMSGVEKLWLTENDVPVVFLSAGVGITPVLAMLENIYKTRPASWLHAAQNGDVHAYRDRLREISAIRAGELIRRVWYEDPLPEDGPPAGDGANPDLYNTNHETVPH